MLVWLAAASLVQSSVSHPTPKPAAQYIASAFKTHPLIAFSEPGHGARGTKEFFASLIRYPGFAGTVTDIVIECGNARYQPIADRYFAGEPVARDQLRQIWENTTIVTGVWELPMYEAILSDIRAFNLTLPERQRIRVLLGDPPIDWTVVRGPADEDMNDWRDAHFAWVVEEQVMKKGRRALLWIGGAHTSRRVMFPDSLIDLLEARFPKRTLVIHSVDFSQVSSAVASRLGTWPSLTVLPTRGTWLGRLDVRDIRHQLSRGIIRDDVDAVLFWDSHVSSEGSSTDESGPAPSIELRRRQQLAAATLPFRGGKIRFEANSATLTTQSADALNVVLTELIHDQELHLLVKAFADAREKNPLRLSRARAGRVIEWLTRHGISHARLTGIGCGSLRALWRGETEQERAANRRAELVRKSDLEGCVPPSVF